jgi:predicted metal-dependent phosphoesterase TrpH
VTTRALTHIHTTNSWDSRNAIDRLADAFVVNGIELALVCDHNSFEGSLAMRRLVQERALPLQVPVAAEIRTDRGDVIVVFEDGEPPAVDALLRSDELPRVVRDLGGIVWLPHPFQSHKDVEILAASADVIEVFNARCGTEQNLSAADLCARHGAVPAFGADIHRLNEVGRFTVEYPTAGTMLATLLSTPSCERPMRTRKSDIMAAEIVNGFKRRRPALVGYNVVKWSKHRAKELAGKAPPYEGP